MTPVKVRKTSLMSVFFLTGCRVSAVTGACVGHLETDGVEHYLHVTEKRGKKRWKILLDAARPVLAYLARAGIGDDKEGPLFRPMTPDARRLIRRHLDRKTPWRLVKNYCRAAGIDPDRLGGRGIGIHSLRKTAINDAIQNGASMHVDQPYCLLRSSYPDFSLTVLPTTHRQVLRSSIDPIRVDGWIPWAKLSIKVRLSILTLYVLS